MELLFRNKLFRAFFLMMTVTVFSVLTAEFILPGFVDQNVVMPHHQVSSIFQYLMISLFLLCF